MASLWQKTLFYLGLVDDDEGQAGEAPQAPDSGVRTVEPPGSRTTMRQSQAEPPAPSSRRASGGGPEIISTRPPSAVAGRRVEPPATQRRRVSSNAEHAEAGVLVHSDGAEDLRPGPAQATETEIIEARTFTDAQVLADHIRDGFPVVLDLRGTEPAMVRRLVDFATGLTYALDGRMAKIAQGVILVTPVGRVLGVEEQERLVDMGLYRVNR